MLFVRRLWLAAVCVGMTGSFLPQKAVLAQSALPACPPPAAQEYLLLVRGRTEAERAEIASILPVESAVLICQYIDEVLVRAGGFTSLETANAWSTYMTTEQGFESFVLQSAAPVVDNGSGDRTFTYQPQLLGSGYAVLVD